VRFWRRDVAKSAATGLLLLFTLQTIAAPYVCAAHDLAASTVGTRGQVHVPGLANAAAFPVPQPIDVTRSAPPSHDESDVDQCHAPVLLSDDRAAPAAGEHPIGIDMAPARQLAALQWPIPRLPVLARWVCLAPPPAQSSTLDIAPRLRI